MSGVLLDTDFLVDYFNNQEYAKGLFPILVKRDLIFISPLTITELRTGFTQQQADSSLPGLYQIARIADVTKQIAEYAGEIRADFVRKGRLLPTVDTLIAATAILNNFKLVTRNKKDFPMPQIKFYKL